MMFAAVSRTDAMCIEVLRRKLIKVDIRTGRAWSIRFGGRELNHTNTKGYRVFTMHLDGGRAQIKLHRLIWIAAHGPIPVGLVPDHKNRIRHDNRICNLILVDSKGNALNRRTYKGAANPAAKITHEIALLIRTAANASSYSAVAGVYKVSKSLVAQIVRKELWI